MADSSECPKCGKNTIVRRQDELYQCLSCDFKRDFSESNSQSKSELGNEIIWAIALGVVIFLITQHSVLTPNSRPKPQSSLPSEIVN